VDSPGTQHKISFPRLDSLRALCFLSVFLFHSFHTDVQEVRSHWLWQRLKFGLFGNGDIGVNVFFVLSGFLITYLLIIEKNKPNGIHVPRFWMRRILRIWPLYYACVAFGFLVFPWLKTLSGQVSTETADPWYFLFFLSNFDPHLPDASNLALLWSISVEEQFYLLWPLLLALVPVRWFPWCFSAVILQSLIFRALHPDPDVLYGHTLSCIGDMAMGALGAWVASSHNGRAWVKSWSIATILGIHGSLVAMYLFRHLLAQSSLAGLVMERSIIAVLATGVILYQCFGPRTLLSLPESGYLGRLGRISYGLYCLHTIGILVAIQVLHRVGLDAQLWHVLILQTALSLAVSILLAEVSYRFYESPFLRLKDRFAVIIRG
jgi:peptidoglycan/LPS O-acetylase OafA/YrhL